jgi:ubiquinone/menaquinone biosynthesis C-methylase UbiE
MERKDHWQQIYTTKDSAQVSWYRPHLDVSLQMIERSGLDHAAHILDVGGGASTLVDDLLASGYANVTVLDVSQASLDVARDRLGAAAQSVTWMEADITQAHLPENHFDIWHDRAVFHFLTQPEDRLRYVAAVNRSLKIGGHLIVATFAADGPEKCSGLDVVRYTAEALQEQFGSGFERIENLRETHPTPFGTTQQFIYCHWQKRDMEDRAKFETIMAKVPKVEPADYDKL